MEDEHKSGGLIRMEDERIFGGFESSLIFLWIFFIKILSLLRSEMLRPDLIWIWNILSVSVSETGSDLSDTLICSAMQWSLKSPLIMYKLLLKRLKSFSSLYYCVYRYLNLYFFKGQVLGSDPDSE